MYQVLSETQQLFNGEKFYRCGTYFQHNGKRLHRAVWEFHNGEIPNGYHVHHVDGDTANNDIANLELLAQHDHISMHLSTDKARERSRKHIETIRPLAVAWHKSPDASAFYKAHSAEWAKHRKTVPLKCEHCGKPFTSTMSDTKFCSIACKAAARRASGVDNELRMCAACGAEFEVNKYEKQKCCSRKCAWGLRSRSFGSQNRSSGCLQHGG